MTALDRLRSSGRVSRVPVPEATDGSPSRSSTKGETIEIVGPVSLPVRVAGTERIARWHVGQTEEWKEPRDRRLEEVSVLQFGELTEDGSSPLVRVHSACLTGDTLGSLRCDCGPQLESSISQISNAASGGLLVYMTDHEVREDRNTSWLWPSSDDGGGVGGPSSGALLLQRRRSRML